MSEHRVSPVELFFDLVFVFGFTQVTTLWLEHPSWGGLARGLLVLAVLWWAWASFAWLTNSADAESGLVTSALLLSTSGLFVAALAVPGAFAAQRFVFGIAFFLVLALFVALYALVSKGEPDMLAAVVRMTRTAVPGVGIVLAAGFVPAHWRPALWAVAFVIGFFGPNLGGIGGWRVEPQHFAERHGLIVIIAVGESLGAIGFGARNAHLGGTVIVAVLLGLLVAVSFWLAYFDYVSSGVRDLVAELRGAERVAMARDAYTYAHLPMVAGIVLFAFAMRTALERVHGELAWVPAVALCCGCALYVASFVAIRVRVTRTLGRGRPVAAVAFALLTPAATVVPALAALSFVCAVWIGLHAYELIWWRQARAERRARTHDVVAVDG
ncbi:MAG TPA: low temperature requirement protein A [Gaiellaceae bacterium]|jgi:low temperature requirement protein LtrA